MKTIAWLVLEIIKLILKGYDSKEATNYISRSRGVDYMILWSAIPKVWKSRDVSKL